MMEEADVGHRHSDAVLVARLDDVVVADRAAALRDVGDTALVGALHVVAEREECVRAERDSLDGVEVGAFLRTGKGRGLLRKEPLPVRREEHVVVLVACRIHIDRIVAVGAANVLTEGEGEYLRALAQLPDVRLVSCKACAVDARLLSRTDTDCLSVDGVADGV